MKSKPIGVRFDEEKLELIKKEQGLKSPQKVLNWLLDNYGSAKTWNNRMSETNKAIKDLPKTTVTTTPIVRDLNEDAKSKGSSYNPFNNPRFGKKNGI